MRKLPRLAICAVVIGCGDPTVPIEGPRSVQPLFMETYGDSLCGQTSAWDYEGPHSSTIAVDFTLSKCGDLVFSGGNATIYVSHDDNNAPSPSDEDEAIFWVMTRDTLGGHEIVFDTVVDISDTALDSLPIVVFLAGNLDGISIVEILDTATLTANTAAFFGDSYNVNLAVQLWRRIISPKTLDLVDVTDSLRVSWQNSHYARAGIDFTVVFRDGDSLAAVGAGASHWWDNSVTLNTPYTYAVRHVTTRVIDGPGFFTATIPASAFVEDTITFDGVSPNDPPVVQVVWGCDSFGSCAIYDTSYDPDGEIIQRRVVWYTDSENPPSDSTVVESPPTSFPSDSCWHHEYVGGASKKMFRITVTDDLGESAWFSRPLLPFSGQPPFPSEC